jgi:hypothetical protein
MAFKSDFSKILGTVDKLNTNKSYSDGPDERFWKLERDKAGNGSAVIRFLPEAEGKLPLVRKFDHGFKGPSGKWFIDNCPTTIEGKCPVCEGNSALWAQGTEDAKNQARSRKRRLQYIANILVISDPKNPDNEGKVFMYSFGKKIYEKLIDKIKPTYEDETPMNPFDPLTGANFKLRIRTVENYPNYDKSEFDSVSSLFDGNEKKLNSIMGELHDLEAEIAPDKFKSESELQRKFDSVMGVLPVSKAAAESLEDYEDDVVSEVKQETKSKPKATPKVEEDEDDDAEYFKRLASM